jgi:hypothetical protein
MPREKSPTATVHKPRYYTSVVLPPSATGSAKTHEVSWAVWSMEDYLAMVSPRATRGQILALMEDDDLPKYRVVVGGDGTGVLDDFGASTVAEAKAEIARIAKQLGAKPDKKVTRR